MERILLIEDDFAIRNSVEFALRREGFEVRSLDSGSAALASVREFAPDLLLLDVMLPGRSGFDICEKLREIDESIAIIMVSALGEEHDRISGLRLGADDYVSKPFSLDELLMRVRANLRRVPARREQAARGSTSTPGSTNCRRLEFGGGGGDSGGEAAGTGALPLLVIDTKRREASIAGQPLALRAKEFSLLSALAERAGEAMSREALAEEVWGQAHLSSSRTIDVHIRRLRALFAEAGIPAAWLHTVHGFGYRFDPEIQQAGIDEGGGHVGGNG